ncbi:MAG: GNAT family N-acetyltransferase [Paracoccaceae bacterium]
MTVGITDDLETCFALRHTVFVEEQGVPVEEEQDEMDPTATHLLAWDNGRPVGAARVVFADATVKIGRVCVLAEARGTGLGVGLIRCAVDVARARGGVTQAKLGAQTHALGFYEKLGFSAIGPIYDDAGLPHRDMIMDLT